MQKKPTLSMQATGYILLWGGILLLLGRLCVFVVSPGNSVSQPGTTFTPQPGLTTISIDNGTVYFTAANRMFALRGSDGKQLWNGFINTSSPPVIAQGIIYEVDFRVITALRASDGFSLWRAFPFNENSSAQPGSTQIVQVTGDQLYVFDGQVLSVLNAQSGTSVWSAGDSANVVDINSLTMNNGVAYYTAHDSASANATIYARRALDGKILWFYGASTIAGQPCSISSIAQVSGTVYASASCANGTGRTFALRASDGALLWQSSLSGSFTVSNGVVCLHITQASPTLADLYVLQASTGRLLWNDAPGTSQHQTQAWTPGNGYVYLLDNDTFNAHRLSDGQSVWNMSFPFNAASPAFETFSTPVFWGQLNNTVYLQSSVVNQNTHIAYNRLYALQADTGKQLWTFSQDQFNLTWTILNIYPATNTISIQGLDEQHPTDLYLLRATDGKLLGSMTQFQSVNTIQIVNNTIYITSTSGDGNNTPFRYQLKALAANDPADGTLWGFLA